MLAGSHFVASRVSDLPMGLLDSVGLGRVITLLAFSGLATSIGCAAWTYTTGGPAFVIFSVITSVFVVSNVAICMANKWALSSQGRGTPEQERETAVFL